MATRRPHEVAVLEAVRDLGLELQSIFNGHAVMILPSGVNKGSGLRAALGTMGLSVHEVVGIGDAANDHSFLELCECAVAVNNAIPSLKANVDFCTRGSEGHGVIELIEELVANDLASRAPGGAGDGVVLASRSDGPVTFAAYGQNILISGPSRAGKSTFATGLIERLIERHFRRGAARRTRTSPLPVGSTRGQSGGGFGSLEAWDTQLWMRLLARRP